jgi:hypothetical protein
LINYQGRLTDKANVPVTQPTSISFAFFDAAVEGLKISEFVDVDTVTPDAQGIYSTMIGDDPDLLVPPQVFARGPVWLEVSVNDQALSPRKQIASTPAALGAQWSGALVNEFPIAEGTSPIPKHAIVSLLTTGTVRGTTLPDEPPVGTRISSGALSWIRTARLDDNRTLVLWRDGSTQIAVMELSGETITIGTPASTFLFAPGVALAPLGSDRFILHDPTATSPFVVADLSGNTVTLSDPLPEPVDIAGTSVYGFTLEGLSETDFVFCYNTSLLGQAYVRIGRIADGSITFGAAASNEPLARDITRIYPRLVNGNQLAIAYVRGLIEPKKLRLLFGSRTDLTVDIVSSSASTLTSDPVETILDFQLLSPTRGAILYLDEQRVNRLMGVEFSPFFRNSNGIPLLRSGEPSQSPQIAPLGTEQFLLTEAGADARRYGRLVTLPFLEPQLEDPYGFNLTGALPNASGVIPLSADKILTFVSDVEQGNYAAVVPLPPAEKLLVPIGAIGFAAADSTEDSVLTATNGVLKNFTPAGSIKGPVYDFGDGTVAFRDGKRLGRVGYMFTNGSLLIDAKPQE